MHKPIQNFKDIALSFYGCDGGNLDSEIWICGIEWGCEDFYEIPNPISYDSGYLITEKTNHDFRNNISWSSAFTNAHTTQFNQKTCWFYNYFYNLYPDDNYDYQQFITEQKLFHNLSNGLGFKMNLFPLKFKKNDSFWCKELIDYTGINDRLSYEKWCIDNRSNFYIDLINKHKPKAIICTGIESLDKFLSFFSCNNKTVTKLDGSLKIYSGKSQKHDSQIIITPFFGPGGIMGFEQMSNAVDMIKSQIG